MTNIVRLKVTWDILIQFRECFAQKSTRFGIVKCISLVIVDVFLDRNCEAVWFK